MKLLIFSNIKHSLIILCLTTLFLSASLVDFYLLGKSKPLDKAGTNQTRQIKGSTKGQLNTGPNYQQVTISSVVLAKPVSESKVPENIKKQYDGKKILGWIPFWDQDTAFASFKRNIGIFDYISVFWYLLRSDRSIRKYIYAFEDPSLINYAHANNVKVLALVANLPDEDDRGDWDYLRVDNVISSSSARKKHITDLVNLAKTRGFDGINIDYEALKEYQKENFTLFIRELSVQLHKNNLILAVALHPKPKENNPAYSNGSQAQDWKELSKYADQLHVMTYEEHWEASAPGPIASVPWVKSILTYAKKMIPEEKLFTGVPLYGYDWSGSENAVGLNYQGILNLINAYNPRVNWENTAKSYFFTYDNGSTHHTVWYEENNSFKAKLLLFRNLGLSNFAFWRLGGEDSKIWSILRNSP